MTLHLTADRDSWREVVSSQLSDREQTKIAGIMDIGGSGIPEHGRDIRILGVTNYVETDLLRATRRQYFHVVWHVKIAGL